MKQIDKIAAAHPDWPVPPEPSPDRRVVLHTRVVTETGGGPDKTILLSAKFLRHTNYWLAAAYMHPLDDTGFKAIQQRAIEYESPLIGVPDRGPLDSSVIRRLLELCKYYNVNIWHAHDYKSNALGLMLRPFWPMKLITTVHGWVKHTSRTPLYYAIDRWCLPFYHHVVCVSDDLVDRVREAGVAEDRVTLVHNAIDETSFIRKFPAVESPLRVQQQVPAGRLVIGAMGRLSPEKGFSDLIRATHKLLGEGADVELWIAGDGDAREELQSLIDHLNLRDRVKLLGFCKDTIAFYHALDVYVLSSLREGLPNVVLEAMSMRVPVVSTMVAGVPKLISDSKTGMLCPIGDVDALADCVMRVVTDPALRQSLTDNGRQLIEQQYSFTQRMVKIKAIYDRVLGLAPQPQDRRSVKIGAASGR